MKYSVKGTVFDKHWRQLFMKHVLPRFDSPTRPRELCWFSVIAAEDDC